MSAPLMIGGDANQAELWHRKNGPPLLAALAATGRAPLAPQAGAGSKVSVFAIDGGQATYLVAVNDSFVKTQADWHQVRERLVPTGPLPAGAQLYDVTEEKALGDAGPVDCDLSETTARVYAILPRGIGAAAVSATQKIQTGDDLVVRVSFADAAGTPHFALSARKCFCKNATYVSWPPTALPFWPLFGHQTALALAPGPVDP